ncbi:MAG: YdcF family protein [Myxococcales bacterium]|nr:YdcF family protein [Myxococcales bacterium]
MPGGLLGPLVRLLEWPLVAPISHRTTAQAIVVLGAPIGSNGELSPAARERVEVALDLYHRGVARIVCVTGGHAPRALAGSAVEAEGMARWLRRGGVPEGSLRVDRHATTTRENAARAREILQREGIREVCLVTQPFHTRRALLLFRRAGFDAWAHPIDGGVSRARPASTLRWVVREYGSWLLLGLRTVARR